MAQMDPGFLTEGTRPRGQVSSGRSAYQNRVHTGNQAAGCFMARYGHQHELPIDLLERKGLLGQFLEVDGRQGALSWGEATTGSSEPPATRRSSPP